MASLSRLTKLPLRVCLNTCLRKFSTQNVVKTDSLFIKNQRNYSLFTARLMSSDKKARGLPVEELLSTAEKVEKGEEKAMIIDVREDHEIQETGVIPGGVHIPLGTVETAMSMDPEAFKHKYGKEKPDADTKIILSCRSGKRSQDAYFRLEKLGFKNLYNFEGGWLGYEEYIKKTKS